MSKDDHSFENPAHSPPGEESVSSGSHSPQGPPPVLRSPSLNSMPSRASVSPTRPSIAPSRALSDSSRRNSQQHVRFSTDLERPPVDGHQRRASRGLSLNTTNLVPPRAYSPGRSPERTPPSPLSPNAPLSPHSPQGLEPGRSRSRNRGYSLRRTCSPRTSKPRKMKHLQVQLKWVKPRARGRRCCR